MLDTKSTDFQVKSMGSNKNPIRILHVLGGMNRGGVETWLMHILRHVDRDRFQMDFLVHTTKLCAYDEEIRDLGSKIIPCLEPSNPWMYARNFKRIILDHGPYDIVHSHVHHFSGYVLRLAQEADIPVRIAHSHNDCSPLEANAKLHRRFYLNLMKSLITRHSTLGFGCSEVAIADLFGEGWKKDLRWRLLYYGIDMSPFREPIDALEVRAELSIPANAFIIGHIGRFQEQKNHRFLLEIFAEILKRKPQAYLLLVGEGSLKSDIEQQAWQMGLSERVIFTGIRSDIPRLMLGAMDVFLLPSLHEGLPVVSIEAQAAGLPLVISQNITQELQKVKPLIQKISLQQPVEVWAEAILAMQNFPEKISQVDSLKILKNSKFNIICSVKSLTSTYIDEYQKTCKIKQ